MLTSINQHLQKIKLENPLILNMTNAVTIDFVANGLLSLGASPIMSKAQQEIDDLLKIAKSVVINIGTLNQAFVEICELTCANANKCNVPIILDPVGCGASHYRTEMSKKLIDQYQIAIIRGNASEILSLSSASTTKGVDSTHQSEQAIATAQLLSKQYQTCIVISGKTDVIVDQDNINKINRGSSLMPKITGTGCLLSAVVAAFHATEENRFMAATHAVTFYGICGEMAAQNAVGPGSFKVNFLDALHTYLTLEQYEK